MFQTFSEAEFLIPARLVAPGAQVWRWVELTLHTQYFLVAIRVETNDGPFQKHIIFSDINEILEINALDKRQIRIQNVCMLGPGYMMGTTTYGLVEIREIWVSRKDELSIMVVTTDDRRLPCWSSKDNVPEKDLKCVFRISPKRHIPQTH